MRREDVHRGECEKDVQRGWECEKDVQMGWECEKGGCSEGGGSADMHD